MNQVCTSRKLVIAGWTSCRQCTICYLAVWFGSLFFLFFLLLKKKQFCLGHFLSLCLGLEGWLLCRLSALSLPPPGPYNKANAFFFVIFNPPSHWTVRLDHQPANEISPRVVCAFTRLWQTGWPSSRNLTTVTFWLPVPDFYFFRQLVFPSHRLGFVDSTRSEITVFSLPLNSFIPTPVGVGQVVIVLSISVLILFSCDDQNILTIHFIINLSESPNLFGYAFASFFIFFHWEYCLQFIPLNFWT